MCTMSIDILLAIDYNVLVRNKREHKENRTGAQVKVRQQGKSGNGSARMGCPKDYDD